MSLLRSTINTTLPGLYTKEFKLSFRFAFFQFPTLLDINSIHLVWCRFVCPNSSPLLALTIF